MDITFKPIGKIFTPFQKKEGMPIQPTGALGIEGKIELNPELIPALKDLDGFSHIILLYFFDKSIGFDLQTTPFLDTESRGLFATRAPKRPNGIGFSVVELLKIENNVLHIKNVDMLNQTPLLDIKPYIPEFDVFQTKSLGWLEDKKGRVKDKLSDSRFK